VQKCQKLIRIWYKVGEIDMELPTFHKLEHCLVQYSNLEAFEKRQYDGSMTIEELKQYGNFGLGSFNALDGEIIAFENEFYHATSNGKVKTASNGSLISGAYTCFFSPRQKFEIKEFVSFSNFHEIVIKKCQIQNQPFYSIRMDGRFTSINVRSVPPQKQPYPSIEEVVENQSLFEFKDLDATVVGYFFPKSMGGLTYEGLHLHFVSNDLKCGGHILDFQTSNVNVSIDQMDYFFHILPDYST